jgi:DNA polymerase III alpha subunit
MFLSPAELTEYDCPKTWELFHQGKTKGIFQLESNLGRSWSKKLKPSNVEELSALVALIRPGCLKAFSDGKSMTQRYVDRKRGIEETTYIHESLEEILQPTYGVLVYQEQSMRIAQKIAGFNLQEADILRKAIGKKKASLMSEVKSYFLEGAERKDIVVKDVAEEIFSWIEKSARYSFNKSHAVAYAVCSYWSAYCKAHHTDDFFVAYLYYANEKQDSHDEVRELISEAKLFDIETKTPNITFFKDKFHFTEGSIYFGVKDIKSLTGKTGDKVIQSVDEMEKELKKTANNFFWVEILLYLSAKINATAFKALASVGFFRGFKDKVTRNSALYEYEIYKTLTKAEKAWLIEHYPKKRWKTLTAALQDLAPTKKEGGGTHRVERSQLIQNEIQLLEHPPYDLSDDPSWVVDQETRLLGCSVSMAKVETSDTSGANSTCKEIVNGKTGANLQVAVNIKRVTDYKINKGKSKGKTMSFLTVEDDTCSMDSVVVFPDCREKHRYIMYEGNNIIMSGNASKSDGSFIVNTIYEI